MDILAAALVRFGAACVSGVTLLLRMVLAVTPPSRVVAGTLCCAVAATAVAAGAHAEEQKRSYRLPRGEAAAVLAQFATECGRPILFMMDAVRGEQTNALSGTYTPREALDRLLAGTALVAVHDPKSGGFIVSRRAADRPTAPPISPQTATSPPGTSADSRHLTAMPSPLTSSSTGDPLPSAPPPSRRGAGLLPLLAGWIATVMGSAQAAELPAQTGSVNGRVINASTATAIINARVAIAGTARETLTDETGRYRLDNLAPGDVRLEVRYLGLAPESATLRIPAGATVQRDFELRLDRDGPGRDVVQLSAFTVIAERDASAQALALNEQRHAPNIKNVVAIDEFGDRGNENIGDFLLFLPGLSIGTSGYEPSSASLRGIPGNNTNLSIDGAEVASSFAGNSRQLDLREVPANNISRVEITKVPTPDQPAAGLGGSINLISRSGFEATRPKFSYNLYTQFHSGRGLTFDGGPRNQSGGTSARSNQPSFDFSYLRPVGRNFALTFGGSRTWRHPRMLGGFNRTDTQSDWNLVDLFQRSSQWNGIAALFQTLSGQIGFDWRLRERNSLSGSFQYRHYDLYLTRSVLSWNYGAGATGNRSFVQGAPTAVGSATMNGSGENVNVLTETKHYALKYRHIGERWRLDASGFASLSASDRPEIDDGIFNLTPATVSNLIIRGEGIGESVGNIPTRYQATNRTGAPIDLYDGANYSLVSGTTNQADWNTRKYGGRIDVTRDFRGRLDLTMKTGVALDTTERDQRRNPRTWNFRPNGASDATARLAGRFDVFDEEFNATAPTLYGRPVRWISNEKVFRLFRQRPEWFVLDEPAAYQNYVSNSRELRETISAAYVRLDLHLLNRRIWIAAGGRFERTENEGRGPLDDLGAQFQRNPDGSFVRNAAGQRVPITNDALALRQLRYKERGAHARRDYTGFYPSANATCKLTENVLLRAAFAHTVGRPNINFIIPGTTISDPDANNPTISVNNTGLKPWTARSYDLSLESYQLKDGFGSLGVFQKDISNFFGSSSTAATPELLALYGLDADPALLRYDIVTRSNVGDARIRGLEFSYRQRLTFLPLWARGFQVFVNATKLRLAGSNLADFAGYNPLTVGGGVKFIRGRFALNGTFSAVDETRGTAVAANAANGIPANTYNFAAKQKRYGLSAEYSLHRRCSVYASVLDFDLVSNSLRYAPGTPDFARNVRLVKGGYYTAIGFRGSF